MVRVVEYFKTSLLDAICTVTADTQIKPEPVCLCLLNVTIWLLCQLQCRISFQTQHGWKPPFLPSYGGIAIHLPLVMAGLLFLAILCTMV